MNRTFTLHGSTGSFSDEKENEFIKLAGFLENEDLESIENYLDNLKTDVRDEVIDRILDYSKQFAKSKTRNENVLMNLS
ncbi:MAG: hypothetical protein JXR41_11265 [Bacteroidales bacterium]|nr:hypothetical protein [Bacteroidales bacterium]MBN2763660.1 hypothetical protein [Bacteroidales bacterium]